MIEANLPEHAQGLMMFLAQVEDVTRRHDFAPALYCCFAIPDVCGVADPITSTGSIEARYTRWFDRWASRRFLDQTSKCVLTGTIAYGMRCRLLHEGRNAAVHVKNPRDSGLGYRRILFHGPSGITINSPELLAKLPETARQAHLSVRLGILHLHITNFCGDMVAAAREWLEARASEPDVVANLDKVFRYRFSVGGGAYFE